MAPCAAFVNTIATTYVGGRDDHMLIGRQIENAAQCGVQLEIVLSGA